MVMSKIVQLFLTRQQAAKFLREQRGRGSVTEIANAERRGLGPRSVRRGREVLYARKDLLEWSDLCTSGEEREWK